MSRIWKYFNKNPTGRAVGDCAVRAVSVALDTDWEEAYALLAKNGFLMGDMPSSNTVIAATLRQRGFNREIIPDTCPDCYTAEEFIKDHPKGTIVLGFGTHIATAKDGLLLDSWDSSQEVPLYIWYRKEDYPSGI